MPFTPTDTFFGAIIILALIALYSFLPSLERLEIKFALQRRLLKEEIERISTDIYFASDNEELDNLGNDIISMFLTFKKSMGIKQKCSDLDTLISVRRGELNRPKSLIKH